MPTHMHIMQVGRSKVTTNSRHSTATALPQHCHSTGVPPRHACNSIHSHPPHDIGVVVNKYIRVLDSHARLPVANKSINLARKTPQYSMSLSHVYYRPPPYQWGYECQ